MISLQARHKPNRARRDLRTNIEPVLVGLRHDRQAVSPLIRPITVLHEGEGAATTALLCYLSKQLHFLLGGPFLRTGDISHHTSRHSLKDTFAGCFHCTPDSHQFCFLRKGAGNGFAEHRAMTNGARG